MDVGWNPRLSWLWSVAGSPPGDEALVMCPMGWHWGQYYLTYSLMSWMMAQTVTSARLQMMQNWDERLTHQTAVLLFRGTSQAGEMCCQESHEAQQYSKYSKPSWAWSWATCYSQPCFEQGAWTRQSQEALCTPDHYVILWNSTTDLCPFLIVHKHLAWAAGRDKGLSSSVLCFALLWSFSFSRW